MKKTVNNILKAAFMLGFACLTNNTFATITYESKTLDYEPKMCEERIAATHYKQITITFKGHIAKKDRAEIRDKMQSELRSHTSSTYIIHFNNVRTLDEGFVSELIGLATPYCSIVEKINVTYNSTSIANVEKIKQAFSQHQEKERKSDENDNGYDSGSDTELDSDYDG